MHRKLALLIAMGVLLAMSAGCGGGNAPTTASNNPTANPQPSPQPTPTPQPSPSPSPSPTPGTPNPEMYMIHLVVESATMSADLGQITMNATANDGSGTLTLHNADASRTYALKFCPQSGQGSNCIGLGSFATDANGSATFSFKFPQPGIWAGGFVLTGGSTTIDDGVSGGATAGVGLQAPLFPVHSVTTGLANIPPPEGAAFGNEPLSSGTINITNGIVTATVKGAAPNDTYEFVYVLGYAPFGGSSDYGSSMALTTDASGNGSGNFGLVFNQGETTFLSLLTDNAGAEYVAGFRVQ